MGHGWTTGKSQAPTHTARHIQHSAPAIPSNKERGHHLRSSPCCRPQHLTRHIAGSRDQKGGNTKETHSQDACSSGPEFLGIEFQTHMHTLCTKMLSSSACYREVSGGKGTRQNPLEVFFKETSISVMPTRCFITPR